MTNAVTLYQALEAKDLRAINHCLERSTAGTEWGCLGDRKVIIYEGQSCSLDHVMEKVRAIFAEFSAKDLSPLAKTLLEGIKKRAEELDQMLSAIPLERPATAIEEPSLLQWLIDLVYRIFNNLFHMVCGN